MIIEKIGEGDTLQEAHENARKLLNAPDNVEVNFETISLPVKKVLGLFGGKKAKVKAFYEVKEKKKKEKKPVKNNKKPVKKSEAPKKAEKETPKKEEEKPASPERLEQAKNDSSVYIKDVIEKLLEKEIKVDAEIKDNAVYILIDSMDSEVDGIIIGRRGETLDSLQYLASLVANKGHDDYIRVTLDVANYREKREATLIALARRNAKNVLRSGRRITLEPMNPYERHIIHTAVQEIEGITSHSVGSNFDRRVVISLADGYRAKGGRRNDRARGYSRSSRPRRSESNASSEEREIKKDISSAPLYGIVSSPAKEDGSSEE